VERLADRTVSRARFETWPTLGAVALVGAALFAQALLRRHARADAVALSALLAASRVAHRASLGLASVALYAGRRTLEHAGARAGALRPHTGRLIELSAVFYAWAAALEASRRGGRWAPSGRCGPGWPLTLVAPVVELWRYIQAWHP
jgi:hypothetical protein